MTRLLRLLALLLALGLAGMPGGVRAQVEITQTEYATWEEIAKRAEDAIESERASTAVFEDLRGELTVWRGRFDAAKGQNSSAIATVERQLKTLGAPPETGNESADIQVQRDRLNQRLHELKEPATNAELAHERAEGLIKGVDQIIRNRQAEKLLEVGPSPINPAHWPVAGEALWNVGETAAFEFSDNWQTETNRDELRKNLPLIVVLVVVGLILILRGRNWSRHLSNRVLTADAGAGRWLLGFVISLGSLVLPFVGVIALTETLYRTGLVGLWSEQLIDGLIPAVFTYLLSRWLAMRIFPHKEPRHLQLSLDEAGCRSGRWYGALLGLILAAFVLLNHISDFRDWSAPTHNVIIFAVMVLGAVFLYRLAGLIRVHCHNVTEAEEEESFRIRVVRFFAFGLIVLAFAAPLLAVMGYFSLAQFLIFPTLVSLQLLASIMVLQRLFTEIYILVTGNGENADSLITVLAGFLLILLSLPVFALIWGARLTDLSELWTRFTEGVYIGDARISPTIFLNFALVFALGYMATRLLQGTLKNSILPKTRMDKGGRNAVVAGVGYLGIFLAAIIAITSAGIDLSSLAIVAGALSVGIGFGLQNIVSNFVSGIILLIERPISEGDWIEVGGQHGTVRDISVRSTRIETFDRTDVIVPNSDFISGTVTNYTRGNTVGRVIVKVAVAYGSDTRQVERILQEIGQSHPMVLANPEPYVVFSGFGERGMEFEIRAILRDVNWVLNVHSDMNHEIARRFTEEGIEVPVTQSDIWLRNPETLQGAGATPRPVAKPTAGGPSTVRMGLADGDMDAGGSDGDGDR